MPKRFLQDEIENETSDDAFYINSPENDRLDSGNISKENDFVYMVEIITEIQRTVPSP